MHVGGENAGAPGDDQLGVAELFRLGAVAEAERLHETRAAGRRADGAVEPRCAQPMEETAIHAGAVQQVPWCRRSCTAGSIPGRVQPEICASLRGDGIERFIPRDALEAAFALCARRASADRASRSWRVLALQVSRHFAAQESARDRMIGIAAQVAAFAVVDIDEQRAAVRAIQRADGMANIRHVLDYTVGRFG